MEGTDESSLDDAGEAGPDNGNDGVFSLSSSPSSRGV